MAERRLDLTHRAHNEDYGETNKYESKTSSLPVIKQTKNIPRMMNSNPSGEQSPAPRTNLFQIRKGS